MIVEGSFVLLSPVIQKFARHTIYLDTTWMQSLERRMRSVKPKGLKNCGNILREEIEYLCGEYRDFYHNQEIHQLAVEAECKAPAKDCIFAFVSKLEILDIL